jgi:hypothetical protein
MHLFFNTAIGLNYIVVLQGTDLTPQDPLNMAIGGNRLAYTSFLQYVCARFDKKI